MTAAFLGRIALAIGVLMFAAEAMARAQQAETRTRTDQYGDPLPPGAVMRLGTLRHRAVHWETRRKALPDGKTAIFSTPWDVRWLDATSGQILKTWPLPTGLIVCGFSDDGRLAVLKDQKERPQDDTILLVWDMSARKELRALDVKEFWGSVDPYFTADGKFLATLHGVNFNPGLVRMWDLATGKELWHEGVMGFYDRGLWPFGFIADGKTLIVLDKQKMRVSLRERATGRERRAFDTMPLGNTRMWRLSPDGKTVMMGTDGAAVRLWDVATGKELPCLEGHTGQARSCAFGRDGKTVLTGGNDPFVVVWNWPAGKLRRKLDLGDERGVESLDVSADGKRAEIVIWGERATRFYDLASGKELPPPHPAHRGPVYGVVVTADGKLVSAGTDNTIRVWETDTGRQLRAIETQHPVGASTLAVSADGQLIATADFNRGKVSLHERDTGKALPVIDTGGGAVHWLAFAAQGRSLFIKGNQDGANRPGASEPFLAVWDGDSGKELRRFKGAIHGPQALSPDGRLLAATGQSAVHVYDAGTGRERMTLAQRESYNLAFSPDGRTVAITGEADAKATILWELASGKERARIQETTVDRNAHLCFSPDGRWLARQEDRFIQLWDARHGRKVDTFKGHENSVNGMTFSRDGRTLVSCSFDTTILIWDVAGAVARQPPQKSATDQAVSEVWSALADADAKTAYRALTALSDAPSQAVPLLRDHLKPAPSLDAKRVEGWLAELDSDVFADRQRAAKELERLGDAIEAALRNFLESTASAEGRRRAEALLKRAAGAIADTDLLRDVRAVEVLESIADSESRKLLGELAQGAPEARLTREAKAALERLARRSK
jgi:WD40 repeat protein